MLVAGTNPSVSANSTHFTVTGLNIVNPGTGFTTTPGITISGGTGATVVGNDTSFILNGFSLTNNGGNYTTSPNVSISGGTATATANLSAIKLASDSSMGGTGDLTINSVISGGYGLTKIGTGTLTLTADNTYSGTTTISTGNLSVGNVTGSATGSGSVHVMGTATTVSGTGIISPAGGGSVIFANGTTLSVGRAGDASGKTFTITPSSGTVSTEFQNGSTLELDLFSGAGLGDNTGNASAADVFQFGGSFTRSRVP